MLLACSTVRWLAVLLILHCGRSDAYVGRLRKRDASSSGLTGTCRQLTLPSVATASASAAACLNHSLVQLPTNSTCIPPPALVDDSVAAFQDHQAHADVVIFIHVDSRVSGSKATQGLLLQLNALVNGTWKECGCIIASVAVLQSSSWLVMFDRNIHGFIECLDPFPSLFFKRLVRIEATSLPLAPNITDQNRQTYISRSSALNSCVEDLCHPQGCHDICGPLAPAVDIQELTNTSARLSWDRALRPHPNITMTTTSYVVSVTSLTNDIIYNETHSVENRTALFRNLRPHVFYVYKVFALAILTVLDSKRRIISMAVTGTPAVKRYAILEIRNGNFSTWNMSSPCRPVNSICGLGHRNLMRSCTNPTPANGGLPCQGDVHKIVECFEPCKAVNGAWSLWTSVTECVPLDGCGHGWKVYRRSCDNPSPKNNGTFCSGSSKDNRTCSAPCEKSSNSKTAEIVGGVWAGIVVIATIVVIVLYFTRTISPNTEILSKVYPVPPLVTGPCITNNSETPIATPIVYMVYHRVSKAVDNFVKETAVWLRNGQGCEAILDLYNLTKISQDHFGRWFDSQIARSNCILVVLTEGFTSHIEAADQSELQHSSNSALHGSEGYHQLMLSEINFVREKLRKHQRMKRIAIALVGDDESVHLPASFIHADERQTFDLNKKTDDWVEEWNRLANFLKYGYAPIRDGLDARADDTQHTDNLQLGDGNECNSNTDTPACTTSPRNRAEGCLNQYITPAAHTKEDQTRPYQLTDEVDDDSI